MRLNIIKTIILIFFVLPTNIFGIEEPLVSAKTLNDILAPYSQDEKVLIEMDRKNIRELCMSQAKKEQKQLIYVATASGPGSSKTWVLEEYLLGKPGFVYVDPDQRGLRLMINTYLQNVNNFSYHKTLSFHDLLNNGYIKWRDAGNYITDTILNEAYVKKYAIAHGTNATSKSMAEFYKKLHAKGYKIILLLCDSTAENRLQAIEHLETKRCFIQSAPQDFTQNEQMFYENYPLYFQYADEIQFFWISDYTTGITKVGEYSRASGFKLLNQDFENFKDAYETFRTSQPAGKLPSLDDLLSRKSSLSNNGKKEKAS